MTTFSSPLNVKLNPETSIAPVPVIGVYTVTITPTYPGLTLTSTVSNTVNAVVLPAGRVIYDTFINVRTAWAGTSVSGVQVNILIGGQAVKSNLAINTVTSNVTPDSSGGNIYGGPLTTDTTISFNVSCTGGGIPNTGLTYLSFLMS